MSKTNGSVNREVKAIVGFRPAELTPLINAWLTKHPYWGATDLMRQSLKSNPELRKLAGKRHAHLLSA